MQRPNSAALFAKASEIIPGGVNSPVRAFKSVGGKPVFIKSAKGAYLHDEDGNKYIELINSWGPMILGHAPEIIETAVAKAIKHGFSFGAPTKAEVEMAELIVAMVPSIEMVRMVNSGTEACLSAIRAARGYTSKSKFIKFEGCYHGHADSFLIAAGSGVATLGIPDSAGVTQGVANDTLTAVYNNLDQVEALFQQHENEIAAVIVEPVAGNMGLVKPTQGFLEGLRAICDKYHAVLIFDEVMTGFRLAPGGVQELLKVTPDLTTLGKIIGGGLPVGAYGGKKEIMQCIAPIGKVYQAGTLSGNPIAMAAGITMLNYLQDNPATYTLLDNIGRRITTGMQKINEDMGLDFTINSIGSMFTLFFTSNQVTNFTDAKTSNTAMFGRYFTEMLDRGVYLAPSQFESMFLSIALEDSHINHILQAHAEAMHATVSHLSHQGT